MDEQLINLSFLQSLTQGDAVKIKKYISMFIGNTPGAIQQMRMLHAEGNWDKLRTVAHSLKPQLSYMGIESVREVVLRIEEYAGDHKKPDAIAQLIEELDSITRTAIVQLKDAMEKI